MKNWALPGIFLLLGGQARAMDFDFSGYGDVRLEVSPRQGSYYYGDLGKLRFGYDDGATPAKIAAVVAEMRAHVTPELMIEAVGRFDPNYGAKEDLLEAYARYRPVSTENWAWFVKAGAFFPPVSLENNQIGWTSPWTITPSAINTWVGYELRTIGTEATLEWRADAGTLSLSGAVFGWNDPAGVLMAERGWSFDDRASGLFEHERLPDADAALLGVNPPISTDLFRQIGSSPGWYVHAAWNEPDLADVSAIYYDNEANPQAESDGVYAWHTRFWDVGVHKEIDNITLLAQALSGSTDSDPGPWYRSTTNFSSAYALAGLDLGEWRLAARFDMFRTRTMSELPWFSGENGDAGTIAATWFPASWLQLTAEAIVVASERNERLIEDEPADDTEREFQLMARVYF